MLSCTRAIVLKSTKYSDNSLIVKLFTEQHGLKTYIVGAVHGKKSKAALFLPLSLLEVVANHKEKSKLIRPKEIQLSETLQNVHSDIQKSMLLIFLNEVIYKSIKEEEANAELFDFLFHSILQLEQSKDTIANFHLNFLLGFTRHLGFYPHGKYSSNNCYFDLQEGVFSSAKTNYSLDENSSKLLSDCINQSFDSLVNKELRKNLLEKLMLFYQLHIPGFTKIISLDVLNQVNS